MDRRNQVKSALRHLETYLRMKTSREFPTATLEPDVLKLIISGLREFRLGKKDTLDEAFDLRPHRGLPGYANAEEKAIEAARQKRAGQTLIQIAADFNIDRSTLNAWLKKYEIPIYSALICDALAPGDKKKNEEWAKKQEAFLDSLRQRNEG